MMKNSKIRNRNQKLLCRQKVDTNKNENPPSSPFAKGGKEGDLKKRDFQLRVWEETLKIPLGEVRTYRWIARRVGCPKAVRAVGSALKKNPYPILIPCHRVVKSNGDTGGYARGKQVKRQLLAFEKRLKNIFCLNHKKEVSS